MTLFTQQLISGLSIGAVYSLLAVGYALVYSVYNFTNWAFDAFMVIGAFTGFYALASFFLPAPVAVGISLVASVLVSVGVERIAYRPLRLKNAPRLFMMISAMGANIFIINIVNLFFGGQFRKFPEFASGTVFIGEIAIGKMDMFAALFSGGVLALFWWFLYHTRAGLAIRASSMDMVTASLMGINNDAVALMIFSVSGVLSGTAGIFYGIKYAVYPYLGTVTIKAMIASIIGGLGSLPGAVIGSLLLGVIETLISGYVSSVYRDLIAFTILVVILLFFPNGLMGGKTVEKL